jgi:hypothetical protein
MDYEVYVVPMDGVQIGNSIYWTVPKECTVKCM